MNNFEFGKKSFYKGNVNSPFNSNTHKDREWNRGFNRAYFDNLEKVKTNEYRRRSKGTHDGERPS